MIRKFFSLAVFLGTIYLASFGQHVFGREDLITWAHVVHEKGPEQIHTAWQVTDTALAQLATQAGSEQFDSCTYNDLVWAQQFYML